MTKLTKPHFWRGCWEKGSTPEQEEKAVDLQHDADDGPADQHDENATEEEAGGLHLMLLEEEAECPLQANDEGKSGHKQDLWQEVKSGVTVQFTKHAVPVDVKNTHIPNGQ